MKRIIIFTIISLSVLAGLSAQRCEFMRIYTDKECYLAGEDLWIKVCVTDSAYCESMLSKVAYVEIGDTSQIHAQGMIALQNGIGWGHIKLPWTMHSGSYLLTAYTRFMRNDSVAFFPKKHIAVLNATQALEEDEVERMDSIPRDILVTSPLPSLTDSSVYGNRSKVTLTLPDLPENAKELTLSVVRKDCEILGSPEPAELQCITASASHYRFVPECEGHIVTGKLIGASADSVDARLACVGQDIRIFDGQRQSYGVYFFYTSEVTDLQDVVLTALPQKGEPCRLEIVPPFAGIRVRLLPKLRVVCKERELVERSLGVQMLTVLPAASAQELKVVENLHDFSPSVSYDLTEYTRFTTLRETLTEFVTEVRTKKAGGKTFIRVLHENTKHFSELKALVLLDGVPIEDHEAILDYDARLLHYIHQYSGKYTFGKNIYDGIVSLVTYKGNLSGIRLGENSQQFSYDFPQNRPTFTAPVYDSEARLNSRIPDFRHTLYWNPDITSAVVSFYTSDMKGIYLVTLQGVAVNGKIIKIQSQFVVK